MRKPHLIIIIIFLVSIFSIVAGDIIDNTQSDFDSGTYVNTTFNASGFVQLVLPNSTGEYVSAIKDSGYDDTHWNSLSWYEPISYYDELTYNQYTLLLCTFNNTLNCVNTTGGSIEPIISENLSFAEGKFYTTGVNITNQSALGYPINLHPYRCIVSFWFKAEYDFWEDGQDNILFLAKVDNNNNMRIVNKYTGDDEVLRLKYESSGNTYRVDSNISDNWATEWHYFALICDHENDMIYFYVDGEQIGNASIVEFDGNVTEFYIGSDNNIAKHAPGIYEEFVIYDNLTDTVIKENYKRGIMELKAQVRSCDDSSCSGESFVGPDGTSSSYYTSPNQQLNVSDNRYFQYKFYFSTENTSYTPELYNVTIANNVINISSCSNLTESNSIYVLNNSINANNIGTCININADNITLNCNGYSIYNWSGISYAIKIENRTNIVLKNCNIYNSTFGNYGIYIRNSTNSTIYNITLYTKWQGMSVSYSDGITINYSYIDSQKYGVEVVNSQYTNIINNTIFNLLYISGSDDSNVINNVIQTRNFVQGYALDIQHSDNLTISNNIINATNKTNYMTGIMLDSISNSLVSNNTIKDYFLDVRNYNIDNVIFSNNLFEDNVHTSMVSYEFGLPNSYSDLVGINYPNGSTANNLNSYQIEIKPSEDISSITFSNGKLTNFYPTRRGFYYIKLNVTDDYNNTFKNLEYIYFVSPSYDTKTIKFYIRPDLLPTHGQPSGNDAKAMVLSPPTSEGNFTCARWVQASPDEFGFIYPSIISGIYAHVLYKSDMDGSFAIERYITYSYNEFDYSNPVNATSEFIFLDSEFNNLSWVLERPDEWYRVGIKLIGINPIIKTNTTDMSYVNFTINYTNTPYIKSMSDNETEIMSATMPYYLGSALIIMNGSGTINMTVEMPYTANSYNAYFDGVDCDSNPNCSFTYYGKELNFTLVLGSEHTLEINSGGELYTVCDSGCDFVELNECLYAINNSNSTCVILQDSTKTYYINNSYYLSSYNGSSIIVNSTAPITIDCQFNTLYSIYKNNTLFNITNVNDVAIRNCIIRYSRMYGYVPFKVSFYIDNSTNISLYNINVNNGVSCTYDHILAYDSSNINLVNFSSSTDYPYEGMVRLYNVSNLNANMLNTGCGLIVNGNTCTINSLGGTIRYINFMCNNSVISNSQLSHLDAQLYTNSVALNYDNAIAIEANNITLNNISITPLDYGDRYVNVSLINLTGNNIYFKNNYISKLWASYKAPIRTIFANGDNITILNNTFNNLGSKSNGIYFKDSNNVTISKNTFYIINKSVEVYDSSLISITNNTFNITNDTYIYNSNNVTISDNEYYNCGGRVNAYFVGFTPVEYNGKAYDDVVAVNIELTNIFNTATCGVNYVDQIDGTTDYDLFLLEDPSNLTGFGAGANITIFIESGSGLSCALFNAFGLICDYESYGALKANGYGNNYTLVDTNVTLLDECSDRQPLFEFNYQYLPRGYAITLNNATGSYISRNLFFGDTNVRQINSVNSSDTEFWLNSLISGAFNNYDGVSACYGSEGNFYVENYTGNMPSDECGLVDITYYYDFGDGNVLIDWKKQSSVYDISYYVYGNDSLQLTTDETITRFTPSVNYSYVTVKPYDNDNGVFGIADLYNATYPTAPAPTPSAPAEAISGGSYPHGAPWYKNFTFCIEKENKTKIGIDAYPGYKYEGMLIIKNLGNAGINVTISCSYDGIIDNPCEFTKIENTSLYVLPDETAYTGIEINVPKDIELGSYYYKLVAVDNNGIRNEIEIFLNVKKKTIIDAIKEKGKEAKEVIEESGMPLWFIILVVVLLISLVSYTIYYYRRKKWKEKA